VHVRKTPTRHSPFALLLALSVSVLATPAAADWKDGGLKKQSKKSPKYDEEYETDSKKESGKDSGPQEAAAADTEAAPESENPRRTSDRAFAVGARLGFGLPLGSMGGESSESSVALSNLTSGGVPAQLDVGYFITPNLYVGGSFQYAFLTFAMDCPSPASCSTSQLRFGVNASYVFKPVGKVTPWAGLGLGYEFVRLGISATVQGQSFNMSQTLRGFEFANLQGGADFQIGKSLWVGPYATFTVGQFTNVSLDLGELGDFGFSDEGLEGEIPRKDFHFWPMGGVRVLYRL
jgi:hypothetical protein